ncbi:pyridoxal phosphate-dependent decarboxylase family protein [Flavobacterium stagni]|uniref:Aspartate aminotransferase family protein n=1 Tax=Flavobacterium stagni TaxID=2506421 RepID=A0A4Q1KC11_9FLAO|nr:pyridoxal-dependent decarboxylase [Flavobacterium stagni]RXR24236.1 aspartate aminotransferase family protein [Flavobacterium stagni]
MQYWTKLPDSERKAKIQKALAANINFSEDITLGFPASHLDSKVFYDAPFLNDAPVLQTFVANPNHIGCHTLGDSEHVFQGTQELEREVLNVLAVDIFKAEPQQFDGYISPGGTEANIQALWMYRNYFKQQCGALSHEIVIICSTDTHYSIPKGANLLQLDLLQIPVDFETRQIDATLLDIQLQKARENGKKYAIVVSNMGTTLFGSIDNPTVYAEALEKWGFQFKLHLDGAYGGFVYPFSQPDSELHFGNPLVSSITVDAHKMLQAPYGTGIFLCRKGLIENVLTEDAQYVEGMDLTLCGSRSGANAIAVWMILFTYGPHQWFEKISVLQMRTRFLCQQLDTLDIPYYRHPDMNIVTMKASAIPEEIAHRFHLVPDTHFGEPLWYKIVVMDHVEVSHLTTFTEELKLHVHA